MFAYCELLPRDLQLFPDDGVSFVEVKGGTGAMLSKLKDGSLEACVALTEWCVCLFKSRGLLFITAGLSLVAADLLKVFAAARAWLVRGSAGLRCLASGVM
jgi:hypothetical protein